jgi:hypothetical protein
LSFDSGLVEARRWFGDGLTVAGGGSAVVRSWLSGGPMVARW